MWGGVGEVARSMARVVCRDEDSRVGAQARVGADSSPAEKYRLYLAAPLNQLPCHATI